MASSNNASLNVLSLSAEELAMIFGCLGPVNIMPRWGDAAKKIIVIVSLTSFMVDDEKSYNAMRAMATTLPNLQHLELGYMSGYDFSTGIGHRYANGEDPDEYEAHSTSNHITHNIVDMVSNFTKLRVLKLERASSLNVNGKYPCLFNFPLLQHLTVSTCPYLKWDLGLRVLKDTLERLTLQSCPKVEGNFMDHADFPKLKSLILRQMDSITGDIRNMSETSFPKLENLILPDMSKYGGAGRLVWAHGAQRHTGSRVQHVATAAIGNAGSVGRFAKNSAPPMASY
eukprot:scaffold4477_cov91-Skeletonema_dohrnii-CCMP3373.AAC.1